MSCHRNSCSYQLAYGKTGCYTVDTWTRVWTAQVHLCEIFFPINIQSALPIPGFCNRRFNLPWIKYSICDPRLGLGRCGGPHVCIVLRYFTKGTWASTGVGICRYQGMTSCFWESQKLRVGVTSLVHLVSTNCTSFHFVAEPMEEVKWGLTVHPHFDIKHFTLKTLGKISTGGMCHGYLPWGYAHPVHLIPQFKAEKIFKSSFSSITLP